MPSLYNGLSGNIGYLGAVNITSVTDDNPMVVVATAHGMTTGDKCHITGHTTVLTVNGIWTATVIDANTFSVPGNGGGGGDGGASGSVQPLTMGATYQIPSDGDARSAASVDGALETLGDRSTIQAIATGKYKLAQVLTFLVNDDAATTWDTVATSATTWTAGAVTFTGLATVAGDIIDVTLDTTINVNTSAANAVGLGFATAVYGGALTYAELLGSSKTVDHALTYTPITFSGRIITGVITGAAAFCVGHKASSASATTTIFIGSYTLKAMVWRPTGVPQ